MVDLPSLAGVCSGPGPVPLRHGFLVVFLHHAQRIEAKEAVVVGRGVFCGHIVPSVFAQDVHRIIHPVSFSLSPRLLLALVYRYRLRESARP
jgi:hypothetical protein